MGLYGFIGEDKLPNYIGIIIIWDYIINHDIRIPSLTNQDSMESRRFFFVAQLFNVQVVKYMVVTHTHMCFNKLGAKFISISIIYIYDF